VTDVLPAERTRQAGAVRPVWLLLGATELVRLLRHPAFLGGVVFLLVTTGLGGALEGTPGPRQAYSDLTSTGILVLGPVTFFAANLLASRDLRSRSLEWLSSAPTPRRHRTIAALVATGGPVAVAGLLLVLGYLAFSGLGWLSLAPNALELVTVPLSVLGSGLLGVLVARWLPWPGCAAAVAVTLVAAHVALPERWTLLGSYVEFASWGDTPSEWAGVIDGSRTWHVVYLLALCAMAATGALLADARRQRPVLAVGGALTTLALLAGWAQLP
jgi:hypothetical protein